MYTIVQELPYAKKKKEIVNIIICFNVYTRKPVESFIDAYIFILPPKKPVVTHVLS